MGRSSRVSRCLVLLALVTSFGACGRNTPPPLQKPTIALSLTSLSFTATAGGANPANQTVTLSNTGNAALNFQATATSTPVGWLAVSPTSGNVTAGGSTSLMATVNIVGLAAGNFTGGISVSDPQATNSPQSVSVVLAVSNPQPNLTSLSPSSATAGGAVFTLSVTGTGFVSGSVVRWNGTDRTTTFVSSTQLTAAIPASDIATAGTAQVTVFNPTPGGGTSNTLTFATNNPAPAITSLSPSSTTAGGAAFTLTVDGSGFVANSVVQWNGSNRTTNFVNSTQLTASIPASDLAGCGGTAQVSVVNPTPGGGTSAAATFTINNPTPTLTSLTPSSVTAGGTALTLTVNGTNFLSGACASVVQWNGSNRTTTFVSGTELTASIPATDIAAAGTAQVTVFSPTPGGGTSNALTFTINNPVPNLTALSPSTATAGGAGFTLTVNGSGFVSSSVVQWNGSNRTTSLGSSTQLTAPITAADIAAAGTAQVTVVNPTPGGGTSNIGVLNINNPVPVITLLTPSSATAGDPGFNLTVDGSSFVPGSVVLWNGSTRTTTFVSSTQLAASMPAGDIAAAGTPQVTAVNPAPGGGTSNALTFTVSNPVPTLTSLSPTSATAGGAAFTLALSGSSFVSGSLVRWNGADRTTTFGSSTQLTASISATDIAAAGTADVTVFNPAPGGGTSNALLFTVNTPPIGVFGRVSVDSAGNQSNLASLSPSVSATGRFITFTSAASNLVAGDTNGRQDIFLRDTCLGATGCTPSTMRMSVASDGSEANNDSFTSSISADGRYVAFSARATNLVPGGTTGTEVFVRDTCNGAPMGCTPTIILASADNAGTESNATSHPPSISATGRFVAFQSLATNLVPGDTNGVADVFLRDTCIGAAGCTPTTLRVSVSTGGTQANFPSIILLDRVIGADGRFVVFESGASNLVAGDTNGTADAFLRDTALNTTTRVSVASDGSELTGITAGASPVSISANGRFVAFSSGAPAVPGDTNNKGDVFVRDTCFGASGCTPSTILVSVASDGTQGNSFSQGLSISDDARFIAFQSAASNLVSGDTNGLEDVFVRDTCLGDSGCTPATVRVSVASDGTQGNNHSPSSFSWLGISGDGRFVALVSQATNLVPNDTNGLEDVFLARTGF